MVRKKGVEGAAEGQTNTDARHTSVQTQCTAFLTRPCDSLREEFPCLVHHLRRMTRERVALGLPDNTRNHSRRDTGIAVLPAPVGRETPIFVEPLLSASRQDSRRTPWQGCSFSALVRARQRGRTFAMSSPRRTRCGAGQGT